MLSQKKALPTYKTRGHGRICLLPKAGEAGKGYFVGQKAQLQGGFGDVVSMSMILSERWWGQDSVTRDGTLVKSLARHSGTWSALGADPRLSSRWLAHTASPSYHLNSPRGAFHAAEEPLCKHSFGQEKGPLVISGALVSSSSADVFPCMWVRAGPPINLLHSSKPTSGSCLLLSVSRKPTPLPLSSHVLWAPQSKLWGRGGKGVARNQQL